MESRSLYGAAPHGGIEYGGAPLRADGVEDELGTLLVPKRKRLNGLALLECILVPWGIFVGVFWLLSFSMRYDHVEATWCLVLFALSISFGFLAKWYWHRSDADYVSSELHSWFLYLAIASFVAWLAGAVLGNSNFGSMRKYYDLSSMGLSREVDPRDVSGNRILDSSRVYFLPGSRIQQDLAIGYKDFSVYCVAPIVAGNATGAPATSFSYWAVGVDCCTPMPPSAFWCGSDVFDPKAHAALRYPGDSTNFRHAIEMAEAEYGIKASSPLFFSWLKDPEGETRSYLAAGVHAFHVWIWAYLIFQVVVFGGIAAFYWRNYVAIAGRTP
uniref:Transmembrane protein n=1 Tax=Alexandrium monilatum TaxID=311494 RepID=A0A7S4Q2Z8_9DINO